MLTTGLGNLRRVSARVVRGNLAEGGERSDRGRAITGEGVSRLNQARKRAKERSGPRMSHCNLQISRMFSGIAAARTNCDYLVEIKKSPGLDPSRPSRSNRRRYPHTYVYITDARRIRCSRVPKYTEQRRAGEKKKKKKGKKKKNGREKRETRLMAFLSFGRMCLELV